MKTTTKSLLMLVMAALFALILGACSSNKDADDKTADKESGASNDTQYPIEIKHALGTTTIEKKPERVATIAWGNQDVALALGTVPVGFSAANYGIKDNDTGMLPWTQEKAEELPRYSGLRFRSDCGFTARCDFSSLLRFNTGRLR